jgi:uncharacterized OsmC-like protein
MSDLRITYDGSQHCTALQEKKGKTVATDCPYISKGEEVSLMELVEAGLAGCMLISMGMLAMRDKLDISGTARIWKSQCRSVRLCASGQSI